MPMASTIFVLLGLFGGMAFPKFQNGQTILVILYGLGSKLAKITFFLFPACVNLTSIPVFSIMQRYNLVESGVGVSLIRDEIAAQSVDAGRSLIWPGLTVTTKLWFVHSAARSADPLLAALLDVLRELWPETVKSEEPSQERAVADALPRPKGAPSTAAAVQ